MLCPVADVSPAAEYEQVVGAINLTVDRYGFSNHPRYYCAPPSYMSAKIYT